MLGKSKGKVLETEIDIEIESPVKEETPEARWGKPVYQTDSRLPSGWSYFATTKATYYKNAAGKFFKNRRNVLSEMCSQEGFTKAEVQYIRDGLITEGWNYHEDLPQDWMYKLYNHKIEGIETNIFYHLSPNGTVYRSKKMIMKKGEEGELGLSPEDTMKLLNFKPVGFQEPKTVFDPDENWIYDPDKVPEGWKMRKYSFNNFKSKKVEEVFHYLTPDNTILRGRKHVYNYMLDTESYKEEDFNKFHFSKKDSIGRKLGMPGHRIKEISGDTSSSSATISWGPWSQAEDMPTGWSVRHASLESDPRSQYKSPGHHIFPTRSRAVKFMKQSGMDIRETKGNKKLTESRLSRDCSTTWSNWINEDIPFLPGWRFSIGHKRGRRRMKFQDKEGRVFKSRGSLIRYLHANRLKKREQLEVLKRMLKVNQTKHFEELRRNDKFIKHMEVDENYLLFIKGRYDNHTAIPETEDSNLPTMWKKKVINGVEYFKDPTGHHVFNSRRLVVEFLRKTRYDISDEDLVKILEESEDESDLSESEEESEDDTERSGSGLLEEYNQVTDDLEEDNDHDGSLEEQAYV